MSKEQNDSLFLLVKSLTKSEKRQFKLYVGRLNVNTDSKFLQLFNLLDKSKVYNQDAILQAGYIKKQQLTNIKAHLYRQILISLKLSPTHQDVRAQIREQLDFASILYHKGLYNQSLSILDKVKNTAIQYEEKNLVYEIVELEKVIESQYITRSISTRADELSTQAEELIELNLITSKLSNLSLQLYSIILKSGYVKNEMEAKKTTAYFNDCLPVFQISEVGFREKFWLYNSYLWYSFLLQDFLNCYKYALKWVRLFQEYPQMINLNPVFFLKGNNYLLESLFYLKDKPRFIKRLNTLEKEVLKPNFPQNKNAKTLAFLYLNFHRINLHFIDGSFQDGVKLIPEIENNLKKFSSRLDGYHKMVFYYKFACLQFGAGNNKACIFYLDKIISNKTLSMREDLQCFARILNLISHYEEGLDYHLESLLKSTYKFLLKINDLNMVQKEIILFIKGLPDIYPNDLKNAFINLRTTLKAYENHPYERRTFLYLDIISWLESNIKNKSVAQIINDKYIVFSTK